MEYTKCWLEYGKRCKNNKIKFAYIYMNGTSRVLDTCKMELELALNQLCQIQSEVVLSQTDTLADDTVQFSFLMDQNCERIEDGFDLSVKKHQVEIRAKNDRGILYGVFEYIRRLQMVGEKDFEEVEYTVSKDPSNPLRMMNHWDNMDGSIERGYSGNSFFFVDNEIVITERVREYARMMASIGINSSVINNVNVKDCATYLITDKYLDKVKELSDIFNDYGVKLFLCVNFAAPIELHELDSADPLEPLVIEWWNKKVKEVYEKVPNLGGFLIKADSEGRKGPFTYNRTHADGANMLARAIKPYGGILIWRCFVYNCQQDWRDLKTDRARAGYDNFMPLDGLFDENVILQIKNGPMDFQVREPISPLFGGLKKTNMMLEVQIAQEYTGQQRHVCYLLPWFKEILEFDLCTEAKPSNVKDIVSGKTYHQMNCGMAAVCNTGNDLNWTGHDLAAANLYGFGRLAYDTSLSAEEIAKEWIIQTLGEDPLVVEHTLYILMNSWKVYEMYTSPLGIGWMVTPHYHYGPDVDGYEYSRWGTYHKADHKGIGVDRTKNGTGYCQQYNEPLASMYENIETCPEELLLFFHHMDYSYQLSSGKTILQHIYDTHFEGADYVEEFMRRWKECKGRVSEDIYNRVESRFQHQVEHSKEWRDVINSYFYRKTGIKDQQGRMLY